MRRRSCPPALERGVIVNRTAETVVRLLPPFIITEAEAMDALGRLDAALSGRRSPGMTHARITLRTADVREAKKLHALIQANLEEGHLLPRTLDELDAHATRFVVAVKGRAIVGCAELAPLSPTVAEVRSLAVDRPRAAADVGTAIVDELRRRARREGFERLCAFTHAPGYFTQHGLFHRPAHVAAREDLHRLRQVPAVPARAGSTRWSSRSTRRSTPSAATACRRPTPCHLA